MFVLALGKPKDLTLSRNPEDFWQSDIRAWISKDYEDRLRRVLEAYKLLRPNDRRPEIW